MGARKRQKAEKMKEERQNKYFAKYTNCPVSPRKMKLVADMIKGQEVNRALDFLKFSPQKASDYAEKVLLSAIANWQNKNEGVRLEDSQLVVKEVIVNKARTLKRIRPAAMGRAHLIRRRSNHLTVIIDNINENPQKVEEVAEEEANNNQSNQ
jgi:large subunit ribosomal protein L22